MIQNTHDLINLQDAARLLEVSRQTMRHMTHGRTYADRRKRGRPSTRTVPPRLEIVERRGRCAYVRRADVEKLKHLKASG